MKPLTLAALRLLTDQEFISGVALARALGVSRASISLALRDAEVAGTGVQRVHGRGYRLAHPTVWLKRQAILDALGPQAQAFQLEVAGCVDSTNSTLVRNAATLQSGSVLVAELQTQGRGRRGTAWHASPGSSLTFSVLWRFESGAAALSGLSLAAGVALVRALGVHGVQAKLKWPNDVLWRNRKLSGILVEMQGDALGPSAVVIGMGVNVRLTPQDQQSIDQPTADLATAGADTLDRNRLLASILRELLAALQRFAAHGFAGFAAEWQQHNAHAGRQATMLLPHGQTESGEVEGVADDGALLLRTAAGIKRYHSGEIRLRAGVR